MSTQQRLVVFGATLVVTSAAVHWLLTATTQWHAALLVVPAHVIARVSEQFRWLLFPFVLVVELYSGLPFGVILGIGFFIWFSSRLMDTDDISLKALLVITAQVLTAMLLLLLPSIIAAPHAMLAATLTMLPPLIGSAITQVFLILALTLFWRELIPPASDARVSLEGFKYRAS